MKPQLSQMLALGVALGLAVMGGAACLRSPSKRGGTSAPQGRPLQWPSILGMLTPVLYSIILALGIELPKLIRMFQRGGKATEVAFANLAGKGLMLVVHTLFVVAVLALLSEGDWGRKHVVDIAKICMLLQGVVVIFDLVSGTVVVTSHRQGETFQLLPMLLEDLAVLASAAFVYRTQRGIPKPA